MTYQPRQRDSIQLSPSDLSRIAVVLRREAGIELPPGKSSLVQARLSKRLRKLKISSYAEYCTLIEDRNSEEERLELLSALTTNVTKFFRERHHFDDLADRLLPEMLEKLRKGRPVRIWSAACSSGEEPYSAAMTILAKAPEVSDLNLRILGTDIDPNILKTAREAVYPEEALDLGTNREVGKLIERIGNGQVRMASNVRRMVTFNRLNLHQNWPMKRKFDLIICRNVVIYFSKKDETQIWRRMSAALDTGGHLMIGHSERIAEPDQLGIELNGVTTYRKTNNTCDRRPTCP